MPPTVTIVTPSFNQAQFLEETILSVLAQADSGPLEYFVMDGGSRDGSVELIRKYHGQIAYWQSQPDGGHSAALNSGFSKASGDILGWMNSDDYYLPGAMDIARKLLDPSRAQILLGNCKTIHQNSNRTSRSDLPAKHQTEDIEWYDYIIQPSTFWTRKAWDLAPSLDEQLKFAFDWDWFVRLKRAGVEFVTTDEFLSVYRIHAAHKSSSGDELRHKELSLVYQRFHGVEVAAQFRQCLSNKTKLARLQKRLRGWHLKRFEPTWMRILFPGCFRGRTDPQIRGFLAMM